jgi:hypothetical protein
MQMTEREKRFLELAEKFQQDYCLLRDEVVNTQFLDLSDDLYEKVHALYEKRNRYTAIYLVRGKLVIIIC